MSKNIHLSSRELMQCVDQMLLEYPELADDEELRLNTFEGETNFNDVLAAITDKALDARSRANAVKDRIGDLSERRSRFLRQEHMMRSLALRIMDRADVTKAQLIEATLSIRQAQPKAIITDETSVPDQFMQVKKSPDMKPILAALKNGQNVEGAVLSNGAPSLTIRTK